MTGRRTMGMIGPEPLFLIGAVYRRAGKTWRGIELRRTPDFTADPLPYPRRAWEVLLYRTDNGDAHWFDVGQLVTGGLSFRRVV